MSKPKSEHFPATTYGSILWNTSIVWKFLTATQENYGGTVLPRSFTIITPQGPMWTHNNSTKHMYEAIISLKDDPMLKSTNPNLFTQFILYEYWRALSKSVQHGIQYDKIINSGDWEFIFSKPRNQGDNPVIKHARFTGLS